MESNQCPSYLNLSWPSFVPIHSNVASVGTGYHPRSTKVTYWIKSYRSTPIGLLQQNIFDPNELVPQKLATLSNTRRFPLKKIRGTVTDTRRTCEWLIINKASAFCGARWAGKAKESPWQLQAEKCSLKTSTKTRPTCLLLKFQSNKQQVKGGIGRWGCCHLSIGRRYRIRTFIHTNTTDYAWVALMLL